MTVAGARPRLPSATSIDHRGHLLEAVLERRPVLEVDGLAQPLAEPAARGPHAPCGQRLARTPRGGAGPARSRNGSEVPIEQVVDVAAQLLVEPGQLGVVEHRRAGPARGPGPPASRRRRGGPGAEVAGVAPAVGLGLLVDPVRRNRRGPRSRSSSAVGPARADDLLPELVLRPLLRATGCRGAGRPSTTPGRRRCGSCHHDGGLHLRRQSVEVFQSSRMSWSSKIIALGSGREQPPVGGSDHASW